MDDLSELSKKERKKLKHGLEQQTREKQSRQGKMLTWITIAVVGALLLGGGWWFVKEAVKPLPGEHVQEQPRQPHIPVSQVYHYNSNPPTSGLHYDEWTKAGIYEAPVIDGHLVHSLEHGYIIISYNCSARQSSSSVTPQSGTLLRLGFGGLVRGMRINGIAYAHEGEGTATPSAEASGSGAIVDTQECKQLRSQLEEVAKKAKIWKLIVIPRPNLDTRIALTAWTYLDKFNDFDAARIERFINAHRDHGPEQTMEP